MTEVEFVENRDRDSAASTTPAPPTCDSITTLRTEKEAVQSRLGELHRLLNNPKGSFSTTNKKNVEVNDRAYDMNQKTIQALDTLAEECGVFEATMKLVALEQRNICVGIRGG